jgi:hypothetical protein
VPEENAREVIEGQVLDILHSEARQNQASFFGDMNSRWTIRHLTMLMYSVLLCDNLRNVKKNNRHRIVW